MNGSKVNKENTKPQNGATESDEEKETHIDPKVRKK